MLLSIDATKYSRMLAKMIFRMIRTALMIVIGVCFCSKIPKPLEYKFVYRAAIFYVVQGCVS